ncbi:hypothetical protein L1049_024916 [Liquidambar formosana]|uniref:F-box associated beta-propeller type 1 domain-containing protein n=1 Tax=Liquidambar formosana TaxID=63359 RepID=A0AAP0RVZ3_LIQFO
MAEVYTLGTASWRCIGYAPHSPNGSVLPTFLNGAIHWSCDKSDSSDFIIAFDFDNEEFYVVPPPIHFGKKQKREIYRRPIGVLLGCLCLTDAPSYGDHLDIWVMKDYAVQESWTKEFVIPLYSGSLFHPIKYLTNGDILMVYAEQALVSYNYAKKRLRYLDIRGVDSKYEAIVHTPNLVSLKDIMMGDNLEVQNVRSRCADSEEAVTPFLVECKPRGLRFVS